MQLLRQAHEALEKEQRPRALDLLLQAWRATPAPAIAALIERLSAQITQSLPKLEGEKRTYHEAWLEIAALGRAADVDRLLAGIERSPAALVDARLRRLESRPADPRITAKMVALIQALPYVSKISLWRSALRLLQRGSDVRFRATILGWCRGPFSQLRASERVLRSGLPEVFLPLKTPRLDDSAQREVAAVEKVLRAIERSTPPSEAALFEGYAPLAQQDKLLGEVLEAPDDQGARQVYCDWLLEIGDPRGEFMAIQLKEAPLKKEQVEARRMFKRYAAVWLGPLEPVVQRHTAVFKNGFLSECKVKFESQKQRASLIGHPMWATVEAIESEGALFGHACMKSLRTVRRASLEDVLALNKSSSTYPFESLWVRLEVHPSRESQRALASLHAFQALHHLKLEGALFEQRSDGAFGPESFEWLLGGEICSRVRQLELVMPWRSPLVPYWSVSNQRPNLELWTKALAKLGIEQIRFETNGEWRITAAKDPEENGRWTLELFNTSRQQFHFMMLEELNQIRSASASAPVDMISEVKIRYGVSRLYTEELKASYRKAFSKFKSVTYPWEKA